MKVIGTAERMGSEVSLAVNGSPEAFGPEPENIEELIEQDIRTGMHTFFGDNARLAVDRHSGS